MERKLINFLLKSEIYYSILNIKKFSSNCIQDRILRNIFVIITKFYNKYKKIITNDEFITTVDILNIEPEKKDILKQTFLSIQHEKKSEQSFEFIIDSLKSLYKYNSVKTILNDSFTDLNIENTDRVMRSIQSRIYSIETETNEDINEGLLSDSIEQRKSLYESKKLTKHEGIYIGFPTFDTITNGVCPGELMVVMSGTGEGKSVFLINVASYIYNVLNKNVLYVSIENPKSQVERRIDSESAGIDYNKLKNGQLNEEEEAKYFDYLQNQKKKLNKFYIYDNPLCSIEDIYIKFSEVSNLFKPDVIIVDYLQIIKYKQSNKNSWEEIGNIALDLRKLARIFKIPVITASQVDRESQKNRKEDRYYISNIAQSILIVNHADLVLSLKINNPEILDSSAVCDITAAIVKNRDGAKAKFTIYANFAEIKMVERIITDVI